MVRLTAAGGLIALILSVGCTGTIDDGRGSSPARPGDPSPGAPAGSPGTPTAPGGPAGPGAPGVCKGSGTPTPARLWRLTHTQVKNTIYDTFGVRAPVLDTLPA